MTKHQESMTIQDMRNSLPGMILSLTDKQVELVILALEYIRQGASEPEALQMAYEVMKKEGAA